VLVLILLGSISSLAAAKVQKETFTSNNKKRTYYLFVPDSLKPAEKVPLILLLHGSGRDGLSLVDKWKDLAAKERFIVAGPDAAGSQGWSTTEDGPNVLHDLIELLKTNYPINPRRVYLFGHSAGAVYAIDLALMESEYFAAMANHAGAFRNQSEFDVIKLGQRKIPFGFWIGTRDQYFPVASVRATRDALVAAGFPVEVTEMPGHDHWYYDLAPSINEAAWQFLKKYELPNEPQFQESAQTTPGEAGDFNGLMRQVNSLQARVNDLVMQANVLDGELANKDLNRERAEVTRIAREESDLLKQSSSLVGAAVEKVKQASNIRVDDKYRNYLTLTGRYLETFIKVLDAKREQAEALLGTESYEAITLKRNEIQKRIDQLQQQADDLRQQAQNAIR
jgi:poly(3-hydroxybutyrate) depolymerase